MLAHWDSLDTAGRERLRSQLGRLAPQLGSLIGAYRAALPSASNVRRTPSQMGLVTEIFRRRAILA